MIVANLDVIRKVNPSLVAVLQKYRVSSLLRLQSYESKTTLHLKYFSSCSYSLTAQYIEFISSLKVGGLPFLVYFS